jgi:hypothetical protein
LADPAQLHDRGRFEPHVCRRFSVPHECARSPERHHGTQKFPARAAGEHCFSPLAQNNHHDGVTPDQFVKNQKLASTFNVLSTNLDRAGRIFVSGMEAIKLPFYGSQWHPEKNPFEWTTNELIPHSADAVAVTQYTSTFFVNGQWRLLWLFFCCSWLIRQLLRSCAEARKSKQTWSESDLQSYLIYNYNPVRAACSSGVFLLPFLNPSMLAFDCFRSSLARKARISRKSTSGADLNAA